MRRDYLLSFAAEGITVVLGLLVYRVAAAQWTVDTFGEYALSRKILSAIVVIALVGADIAVVRFIAFDAARDAAAIASYLRGSVVVVIVGSAALALVLVTLAGPLGTALYGESGHEELLPALALVAFAVALHGIAYGYERGRIRIGRAGLLLVVDLGLVPLVAVVVAPGSAASALAAMGVGIAAIAGVTIAIQSRGPAARPLVIPIVRYGAPRSLGLIAQMAFLAAPPVIAAHRFGIAESGNVAFALLVLGLLSTLLTPIGVVLMPRSADMLREGATGALERHIGRLVAIALPSVAVAVLTLQVLAEPVLVAFLGPAYAGAAPALRAITWAAIPWTFFVILRGLLDAHDVRPLNARNMLAASIVYAGLVGIVAALGAAEDAYYGVFIASVIVLASLTILDARRALLRPALAEPVIEEPLHP